MKKQGQKPIRPEYQFWRKRIEGQIRHTIHEHPEWFNLPDEKTRERCIGSTAKRIIGEIVAGIPTGNDANGSGSRAAAVSLNDAVQSGRAASGEVGGTAADEILYDQPSRDR